MEGERSSGRHRMVQEAKEIAAVAAAPAVAAVARHFLHSLSANQLDTSERVVVRE